MIDSFWKIFNLEVIILFGLVFFVLLIVGIYFFYFVQSMIGIRAPSVASFNSHLDFMKNNLGKCLNIVEGSKILDLGCGSGKAMRFFVNNFGVICWGLDLNILSIIRGKIINLIIGQKNVFIKYGDFTKQKINGFDYIYVYLLPSQLSFIEDWVWSSKSSSCIIISNTFKFAKHEPIKILSDGKSKIHIYK